MKRGAGSGVKPSCIVVQNCAGTVSLVKPLQINDFEPFESFVFICVVLAWNHAPPVFSAKGKLCGRRFEAALCER